MGRLGLSPLAFWEFTLGELNLAIEEHAQIQDDLQRAEWERTRWLATLLLQPHKKKGTKLTPTSLAQFPWEKEDVSQHFDPERLQRNIEYLERNSVLSL